MNSVATGSTLQLQGDITLPAKSLQIAGAGASGQNGALVNSGGVNTLTGLVTVAGNNAASTFISSDSGGLVLSGGIDKGQNNLTLTGDGNGTLSGGVNLGTGGAVTKSGAGTWYFADGSTTFTNNYHLNEGVLNFVSGGLGTPASINFLGGTLQYAAHNNDDVSAKITYSNMSAPITIDTNGNDVPFASSLDNTNTTGLTKLGNGALILQAANAYGGNTLIQGGTLRADSASNALSSGLAIVTGGVLAGVGSTGGSVLIDSDGTITAGTGATTSDTPGKLCTGDET